MEDTSPEAAAAYSLEAGTVKQYVVPGTAYLADADADSGGQEEIQHSAEVQLARSSARHGGCWSQKAPGWT